MTFRIACRYNKKTNLIFISIVVLLVMLDQTSLTQACPNHDHDFREAGWGVSKISIHSKLRWVSHSNTKVLGITVSSNSLEACTEISKTFYIKSSVTVCSKCGMATGMVFMTLDQLKQVAALKPALAPLLQKAIETQ